jgi:hypothetical protein
MQGTATGDGPATDEDCERYAGIINNYQEMASVDDPKHARLELAAANQVMDAAENQGCFWID